MERGTDTSNFEGWGGSNRKSSYLTAMGSGGGRGGGFITLTSCVPRIWKRGSKAKAHTTSDNVRKKVALTYYTYITT